MWDNRAAEIRALHPRLIRLFIQEYFDLLPERGRYHFATLDQSVDLVLRTGARPLMCIACKPRALFPKVDQDLVEPDDYAAWEKLVFNLVQHYRQRGAGIRYWEVMNEPDIGEDGGCPYRFQPDSYARFYRHTAAAILRADPRARVGGPALANPGSPILPALLEACASGNVPLHFVSWHIYSSHPAQIRATIDRVHALLRKHPNLHPETILDEWNLALSNPPNDPRLQPCFIAEVAWQMKDAGLDFSCYYQIRDYHVAFDDFTGFMSPHGTAFMAAWWNRRPQFDGLFDFQDTVRPAYFAFKLLSRLTGGRLRLSSDDTAVHGFAAYDARYQAYNLMLWNFSPKPVHLDLALAGMRHLLIARPLWLDAVTASNDENARLRVEDPIRIAPGTNPLSVQLEPYAVQFWSFERAH
ncbi:MAG: hypothetical protein KGS61_09280 [Verrucomicrobia bacterium]|nr:hypothetical protein [Verrucomicrobiota bacterium]